MLDFNTHATILVIIQVAALLTIAYLFHRSHQAKQSRRHELSKQILDKMGSEEFLDLLKSPDGRQSIERLVGSHRSTEEWVMAAFQRAILLLGVGIALVGVYPLLDFSGDEIPLIVGCVSIGTGLGYWLAGLLTRTRAGRRNDDPAA